MTTREEWLGKLVEELRPRYSGEMPETLHVSVGFPSKGMRSKTIGECWYGEASADGNVQVFVHPKLSNGVEVAAVIVHELVHACRPTAKHGRDFKELAVKLGLEGKMTATVAGDRLKAELAEIVARIGDYPHPALSGGLTSAGPKQTTRLIKVQCPTCGYLIRTTAKWLEVGLPMCPEGDVMYPPEIEEGEEGE